MSVTSCSRLLIVGLFIAVALSIDANAAREPSAITRAQPSIVELEDLVFVTEGNNQMTPGCDAISVMRADSAEAVFRGPTHISPSGLAAKSDFSYLLTAVNYGYDTGSVPGYLYGLRSNPLNWSQWVAEARISGVSVAPGAGIAFLPDDDTFLVATARKPRIQIPPLPPPGQWVLGPFGIEQYKLSEIIRQGSNDFRLGPLRNEIELPHIAMKIFVVAGGRLAHALLDDMSVATIDLATFTLVDRPIRLAPMVAFPEMDPRIPIEELRNLIQATLTDDERYLVTNRGSIDELNVVDLVNRQTWTIDLMDPSISYTGGVSINRGWINPGLLALRTSNDVVIYRLESAKRLIEIGRIALPLLLVSGDVWGPSPSIAWSARGDRFIAASTYPDEGIEFESIEVLGNGQRFGERIRLNACDEQVDGIRQQTFPLAILTANGKLTPPPTPTSTSTLTPTPTASATPSPTPTAPPTNTPTPSPTPSATPTPTPGPIYLPINLREAPCLPGQAHADIVLVIDASSSMTGAKLAQAKAAAQAFLDTLRLPDDRVAVVAFNAEARLASPLTGDAAALRQTIAAIAVAPGTRIDRGLEIALAELTSSRRHPDHQPVIALLTDGRQEVEPESAQAVAATARAAGIALFAIGLGADVDDGYLTRLAGAAGRYYFAPTPDELVAIYRQVARAIPCPAGVYWGGRP